MASPVTIKRGCCCIAPLIVVVVLILALVLGAVAIANMTPNQLKLGDVEIGGGLTINEAGLGDIKIKEIYKFIQSLSSPDRSKIVDNPYNPAEEKANAENNFEGVTNLPQTPSGEIDFVLLLENDVVYDAEYLVEYKDTTLAYIFNATIAHAQEGGSEDEAHLQEIGAAIEQVSILKQDSNYRLKIIFSAEIFGAKEDIKKEVGGAVPDFVINMLPDKVYFTSYSIVAADSEGALTTSPDGISINGMDDSPLTAAIIKVLANENEEGEDGQMDAVVGKAFAELISKLGKVGTAETDESGIVTDNMVLGAGGISAGKITVITHTAP